CSGKLIAPASVPILTGAVEVAMGNTHACARVEDGRVFCWGENTYGRLGLGDTDYRPPPTQIPNFSAAGLALGSWHSCAWSASGEEVWCWGSNFHGQLGINTLPDGSPIPQGSRPPDYLSPGRVPLNGPVRKVVAGFDDTCAVMADGTVQCWGQCSRGTCSNF